MPSTFSFGKLQFDFGPGASATPRSDGNELPWRVLILGDFTGRENRQGRESIASHRPVRIDCDNAQEVFAELGPKLKLQLPDSDRPIGNVDIAFRSLEDFHPDQLIKNVGYLNQLASIHKDLQSSSTAQNALLQAQSVLNRPNPAGISASSSAPVESAEEAIARLMGRRPGPTSPSSKPTTAGVDINALIKNIVAPSVSPSATQEQTAAVSAVELELSQRMRSILHHREFQKLEANWRGVDVLIREFGGEETIELYLLDVSKAELNQDLKGSENLQQSGFCRILRDKEWALVLGTFGFEASVDDLELLGRVAQLCAALQGAFVAGGDPQLFGSKSLASHVYPDEWTDVVSAEVSAAWGALRRLPAASHVGVVVPRMLLRQPYGPGTDPIESFAFQELNGEGEHESYLWGSGSFAAAFVLTEFFRNDGWPVTGSGTGEVTDLSVYKFVRDGESTVKPCAEVWLSERAGERISENGLIPLLSVKGRGAVRLSGIRSISVESADLALRRG